MHVELLDRAGDLKIYIGNKVSNYVLSEKGWIRNNSIVTDEIRFGHEANIGLKLVYVVYLKSLCWEVHITDPTIIGVLRACNESDWHSIALKEIFVVLIEHGLLSSAIEKTKSRSYERGYNHGKDDLKLEIRSLLGIDAT